MLRFRLIAAVAVAIGLLAAAPARAQSNATLSGTVTDAQNAVMPGVSITVHNSATNQDRAVVTDADGPVRGRRAPARHLRGRRRTSKGSPIRSARSPLGPAQTVGLNLKLSVGALAENVTVTGVVAAHRHGDGGGRRSRWPKRPSRRFRSTAGTSWTSVR